MEVLLPASSSTHTLTQSMSQASLILKSLAYARPMIEPHFLLDTKFEAMKERFMTGFKILITNLSMIYNVPGIRKLQDAPSPPAQCLISLLIRIAAEFCFTSWPHFCESNSEPLG